MAHSSHVFLKNNKIQSPGLKLISNQMHRLLFMFGKLLACSVVPEAIIRLLCIQKHGTVALHNHQAMGILSKMKLITYFLEEVNLVDCLVLKTWASGELEFD